ncbi:MAG: TSUP family transporter [Deltaproteobacteria bacterium]|nr:TSUP family transporter [Deltaproteobacteria bacterium]
MLAEFSNLQLISLGFLIFTAGFIDSLAGGGGLIALPAYFSVGLNPMLVLGTNKLSSCLGTVFSTGQYLVHVRLKLRAVLLEILICLLGAALGTQIVLFINPGFIRYLLLILLPLISGVVYFHRDFGAEDRSQRYSSFQLLWRGLAISFIIGTYDGFFGPGTGTFLALGFSRLCGYGLLQATTRAKVLNLSSNISSLAVFLFAGRVHLPLGLLMATLSIMGHWLGARLGVGKGARAIRPMILFVLMLLFLKLFWDIV